MKIQRRCKCTDAYQLPANTTCPPTAKFKAISAGTYFSGMNPGWNLGNTLDAVG
jgi:hypothetical protein